MNVQLIQQAYPKIVQTVNSTIYSYQKLRLFAAIVNFPLYLNTTCMRFSAQNLNSQRSNTTLFDRLLQIYMS